MLLLNSSCDVLVPIISAKSGDQSTSIQIEMQNKYVPHLWGDTDKLPDILREKTHIYKYNEKVIFNGNKSGITGLLSVHINEKQLL